MYGHGDPGTGTRSATGQSRAQPGITMYKPACTSFRKDYSHALEFFQMSIQHGRAAENLIAEMMSTVGLAGMLHEHGQLHQAFEVASRAVERVERSGCCLLLAR